MEKNVFTVKLDIRIDWSEMDIFRHVNNVMFFKYMQAARVHYWEVIGLYKDFNETNTGPMLVSASMQFRKPLFYPGNIIVQTTIEFIKNTSFGLLHQILNAQNEIVAEGNDVVVLYDFNTNEKVVIPQWLKDNITLVENENTPDEKPVNE
ncbi:MAG: acyl-CoA thioesterase [Chitinophagales bacterium]|nr:acyl-CoA thioesterase [Chitinophagales bacterium]